MSRTTELTDSQRIRILEGEIRMMRRMLVTQINRIEEILGVGDSCDKKSVINSDETTGNAERLH